MGRAMNLQCICSCVFRFYAVWQLISLLTTLAIVMSWPRGGAFTFGLQRTVDCIVAAVIVGVAWIYASELGRWAVSGARNHIETALKMTGAILAMTWTGYAFESAVYWFQNRGDEWGSQLLFYGGQPAVIARMAITVLSFALLFLARPIGVALARAERVREIRKEIE